MECSPQEKHCLWGLWQLSRQLPPWSHRAQSLLTGLWFTQPSLHWSQEVSHGGERHMTKNLWATCGS